VSMKTKPVPSWYRYCISRRSTLAVSTLVSELNVRSTTLPDSTCLSLVRTTVLPLPGLWCWNQTTDHSWPSRSSTIPFFRSFVDATSSPSCCLDSSALPRPASESSRCPRCLASADPATDGCSAGQPPRAGRPEATEIPDRDNQGLD